jgi:membrane-bound ClpP family serine protease
VFGIVRVGQLQDGSNPNGRWTLIVLGLILVVVGALLDVGIVLTIGVVLLIVGLIFWLLGALDRPVFGRRYYY